MMTGALRSVRSYACLTVLLLAATGDLRAQPAVATLSGRIADPQGAPVPGATASARNTATDAAFTMTSDRDGRFLFQFLPPGTYDLDVTLSGFRPWRATNLPLRVGQDRVVDVSLALGNVAEAVTVTDTGRPLTTAIDGVLSAAQIETLPLNGRNFLELAFLVPGNQPTPTFDPTKTNSVLVSSAGQLGRGGNVMVDGQSNNDDAVGGPLLNLPIEAVQEFQMATSRFGADLGRSASSAINIVTRSGANQIRGTASLFARDGSWQARPATLDENAETSPFDRQQYSAAVGGPLRRDSLFWFGAGEFRNQDGAVLVGARESASRAIPRSFAEAPLDDGLWSLRIDGGYAASRFTVRYAGESASDTSASAVERAIGSSTQRQDAKNQYNAVLGTWTFAKSASFVNALNASVSTFVNETNPVAVMPQLTFPSIQDGASFRMPQETRQTRLQVANTASLVRSAHTIPVRR